jgi:POT family proton-dependent oligopeptide transporter
MGFSPTPLRRMGAGIAFSGAAWIIAGILQLWIDGGDPVSLAWQILPYALLTLGEVLVSATALEFAYSQAPQAMKGVIMAFWYLASTFGSLWVLLTNAGVRNEAVMSHIDATGLSENAFLMFFFAGFALRAALPDAGQLPPHLTQTGTRTDADLRPDRRDRAGVVARLPAAGAAGPPDPVAAGDRP